MEMLAPSASDPTTVPPVLGVARTFRLAPEVLTVPLADAQAADIGARAASSRPAPSARAERRTVRDRAGTDGASGPVVVLPSMALLQDWAGDKAGVVDVSGIVYPYSDGSIR